MLFFAVTTLERLHEVPKQFWINAAIFIFGIIAAVVIIRKIREMNKILLAILVMFGSVMLGFYWIYERNEPKFLSPAIDVIAPFFPSKDAMGPVKPAKSVKPANSHRGGR